MQIKYNHTFRIHLFFYLPVNEKKIFGWTLLFFGDFLARRIGVEFLSNDCQISLGWLSNWCRGLVSPCRIVVEVMSGPAAKVAERGKSTKYRSHFSEKTCHKTCHTIFTNHATKLSLKFRQGILLPKL